VPADLADFVDRADELQALDRAAAAPGPLLAVVYGPPRMGKTRLLGRFVEGKRAVFFRATQQTSPAELAALSRATRDALRPAGTDLLALGDFPDWPSAFDYLAARFGRVDLRLQLQ